MKALFFFMLVIMCQPHSIASCSEESLEKVSLKIGYDAIIELSAKEIIAANRKDTYGMCIYQGQLWEPAMTDPPYKIMIAGHITIDDIKIELDVSGLATPWVNSSDMEKGDCRLKKHNIGENEHYYILDVCFFKGGSLDYMVTWIIYKDKSRRENIIDVADEYPDWYKEESEPKEQEQRQDTESKNNVVTIIAKNGEVVDSFNVSGYLAPCFQEERRGKCKK